jgi:predicted secreted hydrolase
MFRLQTTPRLVIGLVVLVLALAACTPPPQYASASIVEMMQGDVDGAFARALEPMPFVFPRDHGAHPAYRTEWWYYTGNLQDADGNPFGYQLTFFRNALTPTLPERTSNLATNQLYMAHFAITDGPANQHISFERFSRGAAGLAGALGEPSFAVWLEDWSVRSVAPGVSRLQVQADGEDGPVALELTLRESLAPVLQGNQGLSSKGPEPGNASYYYSLVQIATSGLITLNNQAIAVNGLSWMDHEYSTSALGKEAVGWDWFSVQLEDGAALMFAQVRAQDGQALGQFVGSLIEATGEQRVVADSQHTVLGQWTSPRTGITYPSGWQVRFPALEMTLTIQPLIQDQEMKGSFVYWEGAVTVEGIRAGEPVQGVGYVELTGYGAQVQEFQR